MYVTIFAFVYFYSLTITVTLCTVYHDYKNYSFLLPTLAHEWDLSGVEESMVGSIVFCGMIFGNSILSIVSDKIGRRRVVIGANLGCALFGTLSALSPNLIFMMFMRFLVGVFIGGGAVGYV